MGIFGNKPKPQGRGKAKTAAEKEKLEELRYLKNIKRAQPEVYDQIMRKKLGLDKPTDPILGFFDTYKMFSKAGLVPAMKEESLTDNIKNGVFGILEFFGKWQQASQQVADEPYTPTVQVQSPYQTQMQMQPPVQIEQPPAQQIIREEAQVSIISRIIIMQLDGKTPEEAAKWIHSRPEAKDLLAVLQQTPEDKIFLLLDEYGKSTPDLAGLVAWLQGRQQWFLDTLRQLKALSGVAAPSGL